MRGPETAGLVTAVLLSAAVAAGPSASWAETPSAGARPAVGSWYGTSAGSAPAAAPSHTDEVVRTMYVTMGAMAGYMFAVMPMTTAAVTAAVASGAASMWAYDYLLNPANGTAAE